MRLIDADELLNLFTEEFKRTKQLIAGGEIHLDSLTEGYTEAAHIAKYLAPTVDAAPVVRCRDCVYAEKQEGRLFCHIWRLVNGHGGVGYCCYGERKERETRG